MSKYWDTSGLKSPNSLWATLKQNPEALLFLAAGSALLLRSSREAQHEREHLQHSQPHGESMADHGRRANEASRSLENAREHASSVGKKRDETARNYAAAATHDVHATREKVVEESSRLADKAQSSVRGLVRDHPLAVALAGLAAGVAIAASLPVITPERRILGPARHRLSEAAATAGEKISKAGLEAGERLIRGVAERAVGTGLDHAAGGEQENSPLDARAAGSSANKSGADPLTSDSQREEEQSSEEAKAAKAVLDAQQKAVDDIRAGRPAPYYFTAPASSISGGTTASGANEPDAEKK